MPTYNCENYIEKSILSVINQTYKKWELIIINDGSTDNTLKICQKYSKKNPKIKVYTQTNSGVSYSRNRGINICNGDYISFLDSDDTYHQDFLRKLLNSVQTKNILYDASYCGFNRYINNHFSNTSQIFQKNGNIIYDYLNFLKKQKHILSICSVLISSSFLKHNNIKFNNGKTNGEDTAFLIKLLALANVNACPENLFEYRLGRVDSATNNPSEKAAISILESYTEARDFLSKIKENTNILTSIDDLINKEFQYWLYYSIKKRNVKLFNELKKYNKKSIILPWFFYKIIRPYIKLYLKFKL